MRDSFEKIAEKLNNYVHSNGYLFYNESYDRLVMKQKVEEIDFLSKNMIYIDIDYQNCDIPCEENSCSCFEGGDCEDEPVEKILEFLGFITRGVRNQRVTLPYCIYSTSQRRDRDYRLLFRGTTDIDEAISELKRWGNLLDKYLT